MKLLTRSMLLAGLLAALTATAAFAAEPVPTEGFVCPVLGGQAGGDQGNSSPAPFIPISGGDTSILGPTVNVPTHATNDNGAGSPDGDHASPGDADYTAIWATG
jgi:hypothetical protein